jgi:hypothetical protein
VRPEQTAGSVADDDGGGCLKEAAGAVRG